MHSRWLLAVMFTVPVTLIVHLGGPRHGDVVELPEDQVGKPLVYSGPRWLGVYRAARPPATRPTAAGAAQVWTFVD